MAEHNPFLHTDGLIRVGSRLIHAPLDEEAKTPAILPKGDENVKELVRHLHIREKHGGPVHVLCQLRQKYWILGGLTMVKNSRP